MKEYHICGSENWLAKELFVSPAELMSDYYSVSRCKIFAHVNGLQDLMDGEWANDFHTFGMPHADEEMYRKLGKSNPHSS